MNLLLKKLKHFEKILIKLKHYKNYTLILSNNQK